MRIKTITCHDVYNFGASLQSYALMKYLQELGHEVEIIDYKPYYLTFNLWAIGKRWNKNFIMRWLYFLYVVPMRLKNKERRNKFDDFTKLYLKLTPSKYYTNKELCDNMPIADVYFAGSDQIWNSTLPNGKDPSFYLNFIKERAIIASYAASFSISEIAKENAEFVKNSLRKFDFISVREKTGLAILESFGINGIHVLDPVFLLERDYWLTLTNDKVQTKYIFVYDQENNPLIKSAAQKISKQTGWKIVAIKNLYPLSYADKKETNVGPKEFLSLINNCEVCLTNSFHCTAFSIIFGKEVYVFKRTHEKVNSRMIDLLNMVGLENRIIDDHSFPYDAKLIDYSSVNTVLNCKLQHSKDFLQQVLSANK